MLVPSLGWEDPLEKEMATHSSILAWEITWTVEPGELQAMASQRVGHDLAIKQQQQQHTHIYGNMKNQDTIQCVPCSPSPQQRYSCYLVNGERHSAAFCREGHGSTACLPQPVHFQ